MENSAILPDLSILTAKFYLEELFDESIDEASFLDKAYMSQDTIKYLNTVPYVYEATLSSINKDIYLPANVKFIKSVVTGVEELKDTDLNKFRKYSADSLYNQRGFLEQFTKKVNSDSQDFWKPWSQPGFSYVKFTNHGDYITVIDDLPVGTKITIMYDGLLVGEDNLPLINNLQAMAIANWIEKLLLIKSIKKGNKNAAQLIPLIQSDIEKYTLAASMPDLLTDNEINEILDAQTSYNRKVHGRDFKFDRR